MVKTKHKRIKIVSESMTGKLIYSQLLKETDLTIELKDFNTHKMETEKSDNQEIILLIDSALPFVEEHLQQEQIKKFLNSYFSSAIFNLKSDQTLGLLAIQAGFKGIFFDDEDPVEFLKEIHYLADGGIRLPKDLLFKALHTEETADSDTESPQLPPFPNNNISTGLTRKEIEILAHVQIGLTNSEIAEKLFISVATVKKHLSNIFQKIAVRNRREVAIWYENNFMNRVLE